MICPFCSCDNTRVLESRLSSEKTSIRRRRECEKCEKRFTTYERFENNFIKIIKKNKTKERFSKEKLAKSITEASKKTNLSAIMIDKIVESIESELLMLDKKDVNSALIGEKVLYHLKDTNEIAYFRYLSAFKEFININELLDEMKISSNQNFSFQFQE